ncbi:hypothetical protein [Devosia sp.]|jgi:hypothetical protein|uniref:hypothetical protein n=1 Tax=Devosia sp. TaxID=1871048 RepID=UPI003EEE0EC0
MSALILSRNFLLAAVRCAIPLLRIKLHARKNPNDVVGLEALEGRLLGIIRSTHTRRINTILSIAGVPRSILPAFLRSTRQEYRRDGEEFRPRSGTITPMLDTHLNCFVGDSHAEFYSRAFAAKRSRGLWDPISVWLGSKTLLGFVGASSRRQLTARLNNELRPYLNANVAGRTSIAICWTLGSIDVRSSFHELMIRSSADDVSGVVKMFETALVALVEEVIVPFNETIQVDNPDVSVRSFFISAICPTTEETPARTTADINLARKQLSAPTFGSLAQRRSWTLAINVVISEICLKYELAFYDSAKLIDDYQPTGAGSNDQVHLTQSELIRRLNDDIAAIAHAT